MQSSSQLTKFVVGDTRKALRVEVEDDDGNPVNLTGGEARLFAVSADGGHKPTSSPGEDVWNGVLGVFVSDGSNGLVDFQGIGALLEVPDGSRMDVYEYQVRYVDSDAKETWSPERNRFAAIRHIE